MRRLSMLRARHCDEYQGYLTSKPVEPAEFERIVRRLGTLGHAAREIEEFQAEMRERYPGRNVEEVTTEDLLREHNPLKVDGQTPEAPAQGPAREDYAT